MTDQDHALMFGESPDDEPRADPRLDRGEAPPGYDPSAAEKGSAQADLDQVGAQARAAAETVSSPDKEPSPKVVGIVGNTPHAHARDNPTSTHDDDQENNGGLDWEQIGQDYAAGVLSVNAIARAHGCHHSTIQDHAKRYNWTRNLTRQVQQRAQAELTFGGVTGTDGEKPANQSADPHAQEQAIAQAASVQVQVVQRHRQDLTKLRSLQARLTEQAEAYFAVTGKGSKGLIIDLATLETAVKTVESLARTVGRVIPLERAAFNIDAKQGPASEAQAIENRVRKATERRRASPDDPDAVRRATRDLNDKRRADKLAAKRA